MIVTKKKTDILIQTQIFTYQTAVCFYIILIKESFLRIFSIFITFKIISYMYQEAKYSKYSA